MLESEDDSLDAASRINDLETRLASDKKLAVADQDELRQLLTTMRDSDSDLRHQVIRLLNPRNEPVKEISDEDFHTVYCIIREDNYEPLQPRNFMARNAVFDSNHGYYVALKISDFREFEGS